MNTRGEQTLRWQRIDRIRRFVLTMFLYCAFGLGAVGVSLLLLLIAVFSLNRAKRIRRVRWVIRQSFSGFTHCGVVCGVFEVAFVDAWRLQQPGELIIANHPSLLDVVFLLGSVPNANCVVKQKLLRNPFLALQVYLAGYIRNDSGEKLLENCIVCLKRGESIIIFPEGTRTVRQQGRQQRYQFKRGAAYLMLLAGCPIRPIHISCKPAALGKKDPWYVVPQRKITYRFTILAELNIAAIRQDKRLGLPLKSRRLTHWLVDWYHQMDLNGQSQPPPMGTLSAILAPDILATRCAP